MTFLTHAALLSLSSVVLLFLMLCCYCIGLIIYNLSFHPFAKHPGPILARVSPLYALWHAYYGDLHIDVLRCHEQYGTWTPSAFYVQIIFLTRLQVQLFATLPIG